MNQLVGQGSRQLGHHLLGIVPAREAAHGALHFHLAQLLRHAPVVLHQVDRCQAAHFLHIQAHTLGDKLVGLARLLVAAAHILVDDLPQVIDAVEVHIAQFAHLGFYIPGHGDIHHQHGAMLAHLDGLFHGALAQDGQLAGGGGDHDIGLQQLAGNFGQQYRLGAEFLRQLTGPPQGAIGDDYAADPGFHQVPGNQLDGFARPHQQGVAVAQVGEYVPCQVDGGVGHGDRVLTDGGVRAHPLGDGEYPREQPAQFTAHRTGLVGDGIGGLELAKYLRLPQHHGVQAAGDLHNMLQRLFRLEVVGRAAQFLRRQVVVAGHPVGELQGLVGGLDALRHDGVQLGAIAGGQDDHLLYPTRLTGVGQGFTHLLRRKGDTLAHLDGGRVVVDTQGDQVHDL